MDGYVHSPWLQTACPSQGEGDLVMCQAGMMYATGSHGPSPRVFSFIEQLPLCALWLDLNVRKRSGRPSLAVNVDSVVRTNMSSIAHGSSINDLSLGVAITRPRLS
jgi:hypothetical protein